MSIRVVKPYGTSDFIQKTIDIDRKIARVTCLEELEEHENDFSRREYLSLVQSFAEAEIWNDSSWETRRILAPIVDFYYDHNNCPVLIFPRFEPLATEKESFRFDDDQIISEISRRLSVKGMTDEEIGNFINSIMDFCSNYDMNEDDILLNLNNLGWNDIFGVRIIDYGLTNKMTENFYKGN